MSKLLRKLGRSIRKRLPFQFRAIKDGPAKGMIMSAGVGADMLNGVYERERWDVVARTIREDDVVWDIGAHVGYVTLLAAKAASKGRVAAFEPWPGNRRLLRLHLRKNALAHVSIEPRALGEAHETLHFGGGKGSGTKKLGEGRLRVEVVPGDELVAAGAYPSPTWIKVDVEGAELQVLRGLKKALAETVQIAYVATHSEQLHEEAVRFLEGLGFEAWIPKRITQVYEVGFSAGGQEGDVLAVRNPSNWPAELKSAFIEGLP